MVVADINDEGGRKLVEEISSGGGSADYEHIDVASSKEIENLIANTVKKYGRIDILLDNVGINPVGDAVETSLENWDTVMRVNLKNAFLGCKNIIPVMMKGGGGTIINMGSVSDLEAGPVSQTAYEVAKAGIIALTKSVTQDFASRSIRANCICPGGTATPPSQKIHGGLNGSSRKAG